MSSHCYAFTEMLIGGLPCFQVTLFMHSPWLSFVPSVVVKGASVLSSRSNLCWSSGGEGALSYSLTWVFIWLWQVGTPAGREQYIHRLGRTGRAGKEGLGLLLLMPWEEVFLQSLKDISITPAPPIDVPVALADKVCHLFPFFSVCGYFVSVWCNCFIDNYGMKTLGLLFCALLLLKN